MIDIGNGESDFSVVWGIDFKCGSWCHLPLTRNQIPTALTACIVLTLRDRGSTVVKVLCYKSEGRWFDPSWCQWIFNWHKILPIALWPWDRLSLQQKWVLGVFPGGKGGRCVRLTTYHHPVPLSWNVGTLTSWTPLGHCGPVPGLLHLIVMALASFSPKQTCFSFFFSFSILYSCLNPSVISIFSSRNSFLLERYVLRLSHKLVATTCTTRLKFRISVCYPNSKFKCFVNFAVCTVLLYNVLSIQRNAQHNVYIYIYIYMLCIQKVQQSHYRLELPRGSQEVKVPRLLDNGPVVRICTGLFKMIFGVIHNTLQMQPHVISFCGVTSRIRFMFLLFPQLSRNWRYESELPLKSSPLTCRTNSIIVLMFVESQMMHI